MISAPHESQMAVRLKMDIAAALVCASMATTAAAASSPLGPVDCHNITLDSRGRVVTLMVTQADLKALMYGQQGVTARRLIDENIYTCFEDSFDFIHLVRNSNAKERISQLNVQPGSSKSSRLKAAMIYPARNMLAFGATLHEIGHTWFNDLYDNKTLKCDYNTNACNMVTDPNNTGHWGLADVNGTVGGFDKATLKKSKTGVYHVDGFSDRSCGPNTCPYAPLELYLMGLAPKSEVPSVTTRYKNVSDMRRESIVRFVDCDAPACQKKHAGQPRNSWCHSIMLYQGHCSAGHVLYGPQGSRKCYDVSAGPTMTCGEINNVSRYSFKATPQTFTPDQISALAVQKSVPDFVDAGYTGQPKTFRMLTVLVTTQTPTSAQLDELDLQVRWFTHPGEDSGFSGQLMDPRMPSTPFTDMNLIYNFWEATKKGRGLMNGDNIGAEKIIEPKPLSKPILDQQHPAGSTMSGSTIPIGAGIGGSQSFTVGVAGQLREIRVGVYEWRKLAATKGVTVEIFRTDATGLPDNTKNLGNVVIPNSAISSNPNSWLVADVTALDIMVRVGDQLAIGVLTEDRESSYVWHGAGKPGYNGGIAGVRNRPYGGTKWYKSNVDTDYRFQTFVSP